MAYKYNENIIIQCDKPKFPKEGWILLSILIIGLIWEYLSHAWGFDLRHF